LKLYIDRVNRSDLYILLIEAANGIMKLILLTKFSNYPKIIINQLQIQKLRLEIVEVK